MTARRRSLRGSVIGDLGRLGERHLLQRLVQLLRGGRQREVGDTLGEAMDRLVVGDLLATGRCATLTFIA